MNTAGSGSMATDIHVSSMARSYPPGGQPARQGDRQRSRAQRLRSLLLAIQSGPVDAARLAFTALTLHDNELNHHPVIARIGTALQSSHLLEAWRIAQELRSQFPLAFQGAAALQTVNAASAPRGFFGGFSGRIFDTTA
jgi:hypothetical protein